MARHHVSAVSSNVNTGPIAVTSGDRGTCPRRCPLRGPGGCYGENYPMRYHWDALDDGRRGTGKLWDHVMEVEHASKAAGMIRLFQVGNLPYAVKDARIICNAPADGVPAWTYDHYKTVRRLRALRNTRTCVNASADNLAEADRFMDAGVPTVVLVEDNGARVRRTPAGRAVVMCPAKVVGITCQTCGNGNPLCARKDRVYAIGFPPHGTRKSRVAEVARG